MAMLKKKSPIWDYFTIDDDQTHIAICKECRHKVSRGGKDTKSYNTTNLIQHLKANHSEQFKIFQEKATAAKAAVEEAIATDDKKSRKRQLTMEDCDDQVKIWDTNDVRSQRITRYIGEMLYLDFRPFSIVEDIGFIRLMKAIEPRYKLPSRKYMAETIIPSINNGIQKMVEKEIALVEWFSFTTDIWSSNTSGDSLLSFTYEIV